MIELVNAARMFVFSSFTNKFKNTRRLDACAKIIAALTPKSAKAMNKRYKLRETFEAFATSCFDCVCQNEKFEYVFVSREELEENETTSGLLDSLPQNPSLMALFAVRTNVRRNSLCHPSRQNQTQPVIEASICKSPACISEEASRVQRHKQMNQMSLATERQSTFYLFA